MEGIEGERNEQQSDRAENHHQHGLYLRRFEVEKLIFLIKNALCLYLELWFLPGQEAHFQKHHANKSKHCAQMQKMRLKLCRIRQNVTNIVSQS